jgi:hypothetical protein
MAEDLNRKESTPSFAAPAPQADDPLVRRPPAQWESAPHAGRFLIAYAALGLVLSITVIALAVGLTRGSDSSTAPWSSWTPTASGTQEVNQIVEHVGTRYRLPSGRQMVAVIPRSPGAENPPISTVAVDKQALFPKEQQYSPYPLDHGLMYILCGGGTRCAISEGRPSTDRARLLRREALELALYTFHYVKGVDSVVAFMPPASTAKPSQAAPSTALFFRKSQYSPFTKVPLAQTLPGQPPPGELPQQGQGQLVDQLTLPSLFSYQLQRSSDGSSGILIFSPAG